MNKNVLIKGLIFAFLALVCFSIAGYLVIVQHNTGQYVWFLSVGFILATFTYDSLK